MEKQQKKLRTLDTTLPTRCDICQDKIPLYQPWYSVMITGHFCDDPGKNVLTEKGYQALCPNCFQAYEKFIIEQGTQENHRRHRREMRGE
jgi:hypothetical protein